MYSRFSDSASWQKGVSEQSDISSSILPGDSGNMPTQVMGIMLERLSVARKFELHLRWLARMHKLAEVVATMYIAMNKVVLHKARTTRPGFRCDS